MVLASDQSARLSELLGEADIVAAPTAGLAEAPAPGGLALIERSLNSGFAGGPEGVVLVTDRELFGTVRVRRPRVLRRVVPQGPAGAAAAGRPRRPHRSRHRQVRAA